MKTKATILSIDQGTTSSRAIVFDATGKALATAQREFAQHYPRDGWVEHDPEEIWSTTLDVCRTATANTDVDAKSIAAIGISNQRETTIVWDRGTGETVYPAIVWQDRRTAEHCDRLRAAGHEELVARKTGLLLDPYFSATKLAWILDNVDGAREKAERGELAFGTVDCFLLWRLTGGREHATDATNASRTMLFDIHSQSWDDELLDLFCVPRGLLPEVRDCAAHFGETQAELLGRAIPVTGIAGDQQAAAVGQACFSPGMIKSTYGTGCFVLVNTGEQAVRSQNRLLTTVCYRLDGKVTYALEGSIFIAGAAVQWLRDGLGLIQSASETEALAASLADNRGVYLVPAFTGLGAPYWDAHARGGLFGISRDTGVAEIARATLESVC
jgi:glycerol kinase